MTDLNEIFSGSLDGTIGPVDSSILDQTGFDFSGRVTAGAEWEYTSDKKLWVKGTARLSLIGSTQGDLPFSDRLTVYGTRSQFKSNFFIIDELSDQFGWPDYVKVKLAAVSGVEDLGYPYWHTLDSTETFPTIDGAMQDTAAPTDPYNPKKGPLASVTIPFGPKSPFTLFGQIGTAGDNPFSFEDNSLFRSVNAQFHRDIDLDGDSTGDLNAGLVFYYAWIGQNPADQVEGGGVSLFAAYDRTRLNLACGANPGDTTTVGCTGSANVNLHNEAWDVYGALSRVADYQEGTQQGEALVYPSAGIIWRVVAADKGWKKSEDHSLAFRLNYWGYADMNSGDYVDWGGLGVFAGF